MAGRAIFQFLHLPIVHKIRPVLYLQLFIAVWVGTPLPAQIRDLVGWPDMRRRVTMAIKAETHAERLRMIDLVHLVNPPVTFHATDAARHVDRMVEVNVIRRDVDLHPRNRFAGRRAITNNRQARILFQHRAVAIHAGRSAGRLEYHDFSTPLWQYRQSMPSCPACTLWENGTGCTG